MRPFCATVNDSYLLHTWNVDQNNPQIGVENEEQLVKRRSFFIHSDSIYSTSKVLQFGAIVNGAIFHEYQVLRQS